MIKLEVSADTPAELVSMLDVIRGGNTGAAAGPAKTISKAAANGPGNSSAASSSSAATTLTIEDVRKIAADKVQEGKGRQVKALLTEMGYAKSAEVAEKDWQSFYDQCKAIK